MHYHVREIHFSRLITLKFNVDISMFIIEKVLKSLYKPISLFSKIMFWSKIYFMTVSFSWIFVQIGKKYIKQPQGKLIVKHELWTVTFLIAAYYAQYFCSCQKLRRGHKKMLLQCCIQKISGLKKRYFSKSN